MNLTVFKFSSIGPTLNTVEDYGSLVVGVMNTSMPLTNLQNSLESLLKKSCSLLGKQTILKDFLFPLESF